MAHLKSGVLIALMSITAPAWAAQDDSTVKVKESTVIVFGDDPCPASNDGEIIVCARMPESERYRIPKELRRVKPDAASRAWGDRVQSLETVSKAGLPNSCSPVGAGGQTGCMQELMRQAREEQRARNAGALPVSE